MFRHWVALFLALGGFASSADAKELTRHVQPGREKALAHYKSWTPACAFKPFKIDVVDSPKLGSVRPKFENSVIDNVADVGGVGICAGKTIRSAAIYYRAAKGSTGADHFSLRITSADGEFIDNYLVEIDARP